jgi:D-alanine-D-alanine ligase
MRSMSGGVLVLHNLPSKEARFRGACAASDDGVMNAVKHVVGALAERGVRARVAGVRVLRDLRTALEAGPERTVFNLVERLDGGVQDANCVPAVCRALGYGCTGGTTECLVLTLDKNLAKARLASHGLDVPPGIVVPPRRRGGRRPARAAPDLPPGPLFVKPLASDGSEGIDADSLVTNRGQLAAAVERVHAGTGQPALVEAYIEGREFNLAVVERRGEARPLPVAEIDFALFPAGRPHFVDYDIKWRPGTIGGQMSPRRIPADVDAATARRLQDVARRAWAACGCRDYARIDTRMDADGTVFVIDVNANCDLSPLAGLPAALAAADLPFADFVLAVVANAECGMRSAEYGMGSAECGMGSAE